MKKPAHEKARVISITPPARNATTPSQKEPPADAIVIRPSSKSIQDTEPVVIQPRTRDKQTPTPVLVERATADQAPISIRKEAPTPVKEKAPETREEEKQPVQSPTPPKAPSIRQLTVKPIASAPKKDEETEKKEPEASPAPKLKRSAAGSPAKKTGTGTSRTKKTAKPEPKAAPADERLDEALEQDLSGELYKSKSKSRSMDPNLPLTAQIEKSTGLSEDDLHMLFDLGYDSELANLIGVDALKKLKGEFLRKRHKAESRHYPTAYGYRGREYVGDEAPETVLAAYSKDRKKLILRCVLTALGALVLLFAEATDLLSGLLARITPTPFLLPLLSMLVLSGIGALSLRQILAGLKGFFRFSPNHYSISGILLALTLTYDLVSLPLSTPTLPANLLTSLAFLITVLSDVLRLSCEIRAFRIYSAPGEKHVLEETAGRKKKMRQGDRVVKIINDDEGESLYRVSRATRASGFFRRFNDLETQSRPINLLILANLAPAVLAAFANAVVNGGFAASLSVFMTVVLLGAPLSAILSCIYPLFLANRVLSQYRCALIGEETVHEYDRQKTLIVEDHELFSTEKCAELTLRDGSDLSDDVRLASALFRKIGHTLDPIGKATAKNAPQLPVTFVRISDTGVEATVENRHLLAGDAAYLKKSGIRIPKESSDRALRRTENVGLMYVAIDGVLKLSYEIEYTPRKSFERVIEALADSNTAVAIRSCDPNLNDSFLQAVRSAKAESVRVIKPGRHEIIGATNPVDTGAVCLEDPEKLMGALHAASGIGRVRRFTQRLQVIASLLGGIGVVALILLGKVGELNLLHVALFALLWPVISLIAAHAEINDEKLHLLK